MKNLKCLFTNIYSLEKKFVFDGPVEKHEAPVVSQQESKKPVSPDKAKEMAKGAVEKGKLGADDFKDPFEAKNMPVADIRKMDKAQIKGMFLKDTKPEVGLYTVDFQGNKNAELKIGLRDFFGNENQILLVEKRSADEGVYAERGKDGNYYEPGTDKRVTIFTGDKVTVPVNEKQLAFFKEEASQDRTKNRKLAKRENIKKDIDSTKIASEKQTTAKEKLTAFVDNMSGTQWQEGQKEKFVNALLKYNPDINPAEDDDLVLSVLRYSMKNPKLTESQLVAMATYADMPEENQKELQKALKQNGYEIGVSKPTTVAVMEKIMPEYAMRQADLTQQAWAELINKPADIKKGPILAQN